MGRSAAICIINIVDLVVESLHQHFPVAYNLYPLAIPFLKICLPALIYPLFGGRCEEKQEEDVSKFGFIHGFP
jgi:hypothetical protein